MMMHISLQEQVERGMLLAEVYTMCMNESEKRDQVIGDDNKRYVTLQQLERILRVVSGLE
jgi:hypothetical protein